MEHIDGLGPRPGGSGGRGRKRWRGSESYGSEGTGLKETVETYRRRFGCYPDWVHADKIGRSRENIDSCREHQIRLSSPRLGRPPQDGIVYREQAKQVRQDERDRVAIEGKFGEGKRRYGLSRIMAKLPDHHSHVAAPRLPSLVFLWK